MYDRVMHIFAIVSFIFLIGVVVGVISFAKGKERVYVSLDNYAKDNENSNFTLDTKEVLNVHISDLEEADLAIPLLTTTVEKDITVESDYQNHNIYITINNMPCEYFKEYFIVAKEGYVIESYCDYGENQTTLEISLSDLYENEILFKNGMLLVTFSKPKELFDKVVLINLPDNDYINIDQTRQSDEEAVALEVARRIKSLFSNSDTKVYLLRTKDKPLLLEERIEFVDELDPDIAVIINARNGNTVFENGIATYYNEEYFIPFFGNEQFADYIEYYALKETEATVLGIFPEKQEKSMLYELKMPSARISVGYSANEQEKGLLSDEEYLNKVALGIYNGILKSYEVMGEIEVK